MVKGKNPQSEIAIILEELFSFLGIKADFEVTEQDDGYLVKIAAKGSAGLLIGAHGSTLNAIQSFLSLAVKQKTDEWHRINVDIDGWREKQEEYLRDLADQAAERARSTGQAQHLYNLTPAQRRIIHMALKEEKDLDTGSLGEGEGRYLVVTLK